MNKLIKFGIGAINVSPCFTADALKAYAVTAEQAGFDFLVFYDHAVLPHSAMPRGREVPYPPTSPILDPLVTIGYVAAVTTSIRLRTGVIVLPLRNPILAAKQVATADILSFGRLDLGVGAGWLGAEFEAFGIPLRQRGSRMDEYLEIMRLAWTAKEISYRGRFYSLDMMAMEPKPIQKPYPPLWFGGSAEPVLQRVAKMGAGWMPPTSLAPELAALKWSQITAVAESQGRNPGGLKLCLTISRRRAGGTRILSRQIHEQIKLGADEVLIILNGLAGQVTLQYLLGELKKLAPLVQLYTQ